MIKNITYSVSFPTNGVSLSGDLSLQPGLTAIVGDNGAGKTFGSIEMVRYMLFGKDALRGPASDYKTLTAKMSFAIRGADFTVERNRKFEKLTDAAGEVLAVGAEAVTQRIKQELGFGLDVFDIVCASNQKQSDRLSQMKPTARRRLIDEVIGLSSNEVVEKACRAEATALKRDASVLQDNLVVPVKPEQPAGYQKSSVLKAILDEAKATEVRRAELQKIVNGVGPAPEVVLEPTDDIAGMEAHELKRQQVKAAVDHAERELAKIPEATFTAEQLDRTEAWNDYQDELERRGDEPTLQLEEAEAIIEAWDHRAALEKIGDTEVECPHCQQRFLPGHELPSEPAITRKQALAELEAHRRWDAPLTMPEAPPYEELMTTKQIAAGRLALARAADRAAAAEIASQPIPASRAVELTLARQARAEYDAYCNALISYTKRAQAASTAQFELNELPPCTVNVAEVDKAYVEARVYETKLDEFALAEQRYQDASAAINAKLEKAAAFKKGAEALVKARSTVKAYLAPSLARVSSALIHQMSGGVLSNMVVDEDMNVTVDGQDISTLSGAGSTVANLALRLALGQVLVRNTFPVFLADEADADLSSSRAQFTAECLHGLKDQLEQIVVITHKEVSVADQVISR